MLRARLSRGDDATLVPLYVESRAPRLTELFIRQAGGQVNTTAGEILTAHVPTRRLLAVAEGEEVVRLEGAARVQLRLDQARVHSRADAVHQGMAPLTRAYDGAGVVVAVVDAGLDLGHPGFSTPDGQTRVIGLWDQSEMGTPPEGLNYGAACDQASIAAGQCAHVLDASHGTHVTGIAAGGPVMGQSYGGIAPGAAIVYVDVGTNDDSTEAFTTAVCDGVGYALRVAGTRPMVLNMSLGEHSGPHDGSSLASRCLDNLVRGQAGKILVAAAGNEGVGSGRPDPFDDQQTMTTFVHATGMATANPDRVYFVSHVDANLTAFSTDVNLYAYQGTTLSVRVGVRDAMGREALTDPLSADGGGAMGLDLAGTMVGRFAFARQTLPDGQIRYGLRTADENQDNLEGQLAWFLEITGAGEWHAWLDTTSAGGFVQVPGTMATIDNTHAIGYPAIASEVITVASSGNRSTWPSSDGAGGSDMNTVVQGLSGFSSRGPSRNPMTNGFKPDITAPGEHVISTLSQHATMEIEASQIAVGQLQMPGGYFESTGTSMASPVVAGVVALMLQANPSLTTQQVREILTTTANTDNIAEPLPHIGWGAGRVDALAAVARAAATSGGGGGVAPGNLTDDGGGCRGAGRGDLGLSALALVGAALLLRRRRR